jgi:GT2 family glycosyltransferase
MFCSNLVALPPILTIPEFDHEKQNKNLIYSYFKERLNYIPLSKSKKPPIKYRFDFEEDVTFIIHSLKDEQTLISCLNSIKKHCSFKNEIKVIYDNEFPIDKMSTNFADVDFIDKSTNLPSTLNQISSNTSSDVLFILSSDILIDHKSSIKTLGSFAIQQDVGVVSPRILTKNKSIKFIGYELKKQRKHISIQLKQHNFNQDPYSMNLIQNVSAISKDFMVLSKDKFIEGNIFDERYNSSYFDIDFCLFLKTRKLNRLVVPYITARYMNKEDKQLSNEDKNTLEDRWKDQLPLVLET